MKKIGMLLVGLFALFSCEQEEMDYYVKSNVEPVQTRAGSSISDFDPIAELWEIPVNIINVGHQRYKYLTADATSEFVYLTHSDDGSMRQRWFIKDGTNIVLAGGHTPYSQDWTVFPKIGKDYPAIERSSNPSGIFVTFGPNYILKPDNTYQIYHTRSQLLGAVYGGYLQAKDNTSSDMKYRADGSSSIAHWQIIPVGEFRIIDMKYEMSVAGGDFVNRQDQFVQGTILPGTFQPVEHTVTVTNTVRESSSFSKTEGITIATQSSSGINFGLNVGVVNFGVNGQISTTVTSSKMVTYGKEESKEVAISQSFKVLIPANTPCRIEILKMSYNANITYVATLEKVDGAEKGKRFRVKGKWNGVTTTYLYYNLYKTSDNALIDTRVITE